MNLAESDPDLFQVLEDVRREQDGPATRAVDAVETLWAVGVRIETRVPRLSKAERHLVLVHDGRCAEILRQASFVALVSGNEPREYFHLTRRQESQLKRWSAPPRRSFVERALRRTGVDSGISETRAGEPSVESTRNSLVLARASNVFQPTWTAQIYGSRALTNLGEHAAAERQLRRLLSTFPQDSDASYFGSVGLGMLDVARRQASGALHSYRLAAQRHLWPSDAMNWFFFASCLGLKSEALEAAHHLDDYPADVDVPVPLAGDRRPSIPTTGLIAQIEGRLGHHSSRIAHALLELEK